ncbi:hypothetical protein RHRU231_50013 [Rhodococcus ruber]|uniref:Uncharacterized protein n=1 Tax=Rhodococcus ruber TaxID=1830 RepID=A0A098BPD5_9NOCA|nr:hypothetical protein RHRU231_50013 [Rhodococcus ruber]
MHRTAPPGRRRVGVLVGRGSVSGQSIRNIRYRPVDVLGPLLTVDEHDRMMDTTPLPDPWNKDSMGVVHPGARRRLWGCGRSRSSTLPPRGRTQ